MVIGNANPRPAAKKSPQALPVETDTPKYPRGRLAAAMSGALLVMFAVVEGDFADASAVGASLKNGASLQAQNWPVQTCNDTTSPGSLRYIAVHANSGDTIDFSQLPTLCGMTNSTITLTAGEIVLHQPEITLIGPSLGAKTVTLSGGGQSRVLRHATYTPSIGELRIYRLNLVNGYAFSPASIGGGCVYSDANIHLYRSLVEGCTTHSADGSSYGGGLHAPNGNISIVSSKVSGNTATVDSNGNAQGGGAASLTFDSKYSEIIGNNVYGGIAGFGQGAGVRTKQLAMGYSTVGYNYSDLWGGGIFVGGGDLMVSSSSFYGNHSVAQGGAIRSIGNNLSISNSTIAANSTDADSGAGVYFDGTSAVVESTVVARNASTGMSSGTDFYLKSGMLSGADNAIMSSNADLPGFIVVTDDPKLAPFAWTGGPTRTIDLRLGSPAVGRGSNANNRTNDQRGIGFPRTTGPTNAVDIGAIQQTDRIFVSDLEGFFL
ncbi:MAG: choice-of-anchor Q domain-containing protein [Rhodanobacteraceae bacterium]